MLLHEIILSPLLQRLPRGMIQVALVSLGLTLACASFATEESLDIRLFMEFSPGFRSWQVPLYQLVQSKLIIS